MIVDSALPEADAPDAPAGGYFRTITIHNIATADLPSGYTVGVPFDPTSGHVPSNLRGVHVMGSAGERDRIIDSPPLASMIWFSLAAPIAAGATDTSYEVTYGVPGSASALQNGSSVFDFYDDFTSTTLASHWLSQGGISLGSGQVTLLHGMDGALTTTALVSQSTMEALVEITDPMSQPEAMSGFYYWLGFQHTGDFVASSPWIVWIARSAGTVGAEDNADGCPSNCASGTTPQNGAFHVYGIERQPTETVFSMDGAVYYQTPATNDQALSLMLRNYLVTGDMVITWVRAHARVYPEPTVTLGPEQTF